MRRIASLAVTLAVAPAGASASSPTVGTPVILKGHTDDVGSAAFSPGGRRVLTASEDRTARIWSAGN